MELRHLEHFLAVAEEGNFTRAAARLHVVQSALSASVQTLEKDLEARLFDRTTHRVELTDAESALVPAARRTLAAAEAARDVVAAVHGGTRGTVRVGIMHSLGPVDLGAVLTAFRRTRPGVQLALEAAPGGSAELVHEVSVGRLDVAFAAVPDDLPPALAVRRLAGEQMMLACPPGHRHGPGSSMRLQELAGQRFVDFPVGWGTRAATDRLFATSGLRREVAVRVADTPTVLHLVDAGFGHAFVTPSTVPAGRRRRLRQVRPAPLFTISLVTPAEGLTAAAAAFVDLVEARHPVAVPVTRDGTPRRRPTSRRG